MAISTRKKDIKIKLKNGKTKTKTITQYRYHAYYTDESGNRKLKGSKWFDTKEECEREEYEFKNQNTHTTKVNLGLVGHKCIEDKKDRITLTSYKEQMMIFDTWFKSLHNIPIDKVKPHQIKACMVPYMHLSTNRKNKGYDILNTIFKYAMIYYGLESNPMDRIERFKKTDEERLRRMNIWTIDQFNTFYEALPDILKYKALFRFLFFTGLRRNEALSLTWNDFDGSSVHVWRQWQDEKWSVLKTKNSERTVSLDSVTIGLLYQLKAEQEQDEYYSSDWFIFNGPKQISTSMIDVVKNKTIEQTGLPYIRVHDFRHSHASYLISNGANMYAVSRRLGHSSIQMTIDRYTHFIPKEKDPLVELMECNNCVTNFGKSSENATIYAQNEPINKAKYH